ncbi:hypothetical protein CBP36_17465 [Acidovorax carolinensis]|uniref:BioF2-like acetyltransferase domain-containing protein n=1 Tax=Acidovorax carolinensis TaxID=553814 RepID=A0A240UGW6_9BURK|nr:hypothetical protein CBP35_01450 [Acidovorax carolinensis]ART60366.1 hypothetical protein CBP36_17465 [Acidovorax carolinensis]
MGLQVSRKRFDQLGESELTAWLRLFPSGALSASLFMHPEFCRAAHQTLGPVDVVVMEDNGRIVGMVPLQRAMGWRGLLRGYSQVAQDISDGFCFPVEEAYLDGVADALARAGVWSGFFTHVGTGRAVRHCEAGAVTKTYLVRHQPGEQDLWTALRERSRRFWSDTERCARRLNELPGAYQFHWQSPNPARDLGTLVRLKLDQYARTGKEGASLYQARHQTFLKAMVSSASEGFAAPLSVLYQGNELIAAHLGLLGGGRLHYWFPVYEPSHAKYSPGKVLLAEIMKRSEQLGIQVIDFGEGHADYKEAAATETHELAKVAMALGVRGALSMLPLRWAWRFSG